MTRCHKESFESTEGQTCCPPTPVFPWPQTIFRDLDWNNSFSLSFQPSFGHCNTWLGSGEKAKNKANSICLHGPGHVRQKSIHRFMITRHHPKNTISPTPKHFWCSYYSIYRIRRVKNWDYEENGPLMMPFLGFWHENGPGIMQTRLLNIQWLKIFENFAFWIFWMAMKINIITCMLQLREIKATVVTKFVTLVSHSIHHEDFESK